MKYYFNPVNFLTDPTQRLGVLLTLAFFAVFPLHAFSAGSPFAHNFISDTAQYNSDVYGQNSNIDQTVDRDAIKQHILDYGRAHLSGLMPGLPDDMRHTASWALGGFKDMGSYFNLGIDINAKEDVDEIATLLRPVATYMKPAADEDTQAMWVAPGYQHHHGALPFRDSLTFGAHSRKDLFNRYMRVDIHPYVAQNYFSAKNYYGTDVTLNLASPNDTSDVTKPWGKIVLGYANGDDRVMDRGRGMELRGELRFNDNLTLNSGMRQSDTSSSDNFVLLQWKKSLN